MSMASMKALPMIPKIVVTPLALSVSTNASLGVIFVIGLPLVGVADLPVAASL